VNTSQESQIRAKGVTGGIEEHTAKKKSSNPRNAGKKSEKVALGGPFEEKTGKKSSGRGIKKKSRTANCEQPIGGKSRREDSHAVKSL